MTVLDTLEPLIRANEPTLSTVAECLTKQGSPSTSIAILEDGVLTSRCYSTVGDDTDTIFQACSISKAITAVAIMRLVDQGYFTIDSTIAELLPSEFLDILTDDSPPTQKKLIQSITIKQLMSHTAGLSVHGFDGYPKGPFPSTAQILRGEYPANNPRVRLTLLPGNAFAYSGGGITVLQIILETVLKKDFATLMQDVLLKPLGMTRSSFNDLPPEEKNAAKSYETGYTPSSVTHHYQPELAAAGLWTTPTDLLKVVQAVQRSLQKDDFLKRDTAKQMLTKTHDDGMGLSWFLPGDDKTNFAHGGSNSPGFRCILTAFAQLGDAPAPKDAGIAVMSNSVVGVEVWWKICLAAAYLNKWPLVESLSGLKMVAPFWDPNAVVGEGWKNYKGEWTNGKAKFLLGEDDEQPALWYNGFGPIRLLPAASPGSQNDKGACYFVLDGLKMMLRLKEDKGKEVLVLEDSATKEATDLKRSEN